MTAKKLLESNLLLADPAALARMTSSRHGEPARHRLLPNPDLLQARDDAAAGRLVGLVSSPHGRSELSSHHLPT